MTDNKREPIKNDLQDRRQERKIPTVPTTKNENNNKNKPDKDKELTKLNEQTNIFERRVEQQPANTAARFTHRH